MLEGVVGLGAQDQVAAAEDVRGDCVDAHRLGLVAVVVDHRAVAILLDRLAQLVRIESDPGADPHQVVDVFEPACSFPVSLEQREVHLLELALLARELGGAKRAARVDDDVALLHRESYLGSDRLEMTANPVGAAPAEIFFQRHALDGSFGVQLERPPRHLHQALSLQLLDSDRVDVAPGSNVVGEDDQLDGLRCFSHLLNSSTLTLSTVAKGSEVDQWFAGKPAEPILQRVRPHRASLTVRPSPSPLVPRLVRCSAQDPRSNPGTSRLTAPPSARAAAA